MASELSYSSVKLSQHAREIEEKKAIEKRRHILYLVQQYLKDEGYFETVKCLQLEAQLNNQYEVCDNIDLGNIILEFEAYHYLRFQKYPKICKKLISPPEDKELNSNVTYKKKCSSKKVMKQDNVNFTDAGNKNVPQKDFKQNNVKSVKASDNYAQKSVQNNLGLDLTVLPLSTATNNSIAKFNDNSEEEYHKQKLLKPLCGYNGFCGEWKEFAEAISKEICMTDLNVHWDDIMGLEEAKHLLKEAVVYPIKYPELFSGVLAPWKGLLLYGPPGTGKTLMAKAVATKCKTTFFNISASSIVSKWRGDSEKLVRVLFELARYHAPSTIFLDEVDALASHRDGLGEHEASRRLKAELLMQLDGLAHSEDRVFLLATSNLPWELDPAILRRLEKRILVDLPTTEARQAMLQYYLPPTILREPVLNCQLDYHLLAEDMEGYSGSDIKLVCKEAAMESIRDVLSVLEAYDNSASLPRLELKSITTQDFQQALSRTKPSAAHLVGKYQKWQEEFGSV